MRPVARHRIERAAFELLDASALCAVSTVSPRGTAHVSPVYFAWNREFEIFWLSAANARHSQNIHARPSAAIAVYDSSQVWGRPDRGIQLFGSARRLAAAEAARAEALYAARFERYAPPELRAYRFYGFRPTRLKVFDEAAFGSGVFVTALVGGRGRLAWQRTDVSSGADATVTRPGARRR
jgi:uncharacterized protein YhbP (UPF0306 family)